MSIPMVADSYKRILSFLWVILFVFPIASHAISVKSYSYDKYGNVQEITDPRGFVTQFHYDLIDRLERIDYPDHKSVRYAKDLVVDLDGAIRKSREEQDILRSQNSWLSDSNPWVSPTETREEFYEEIKD